MLNWRNIVIVIAHRFAITVIVASGSIVVEIVRAIGMDIVVTATTVLAIAVIATGITMRLRCSSCTSDKTQPVNLKTPHHHRCGVFCRFMSRHQTEPVTAPLKKPSRHIQS